MRTPTPTLAQQLQTLVVAAQVARNDRSQPRDYGTGYGSSSGYGSPRSYAPAPMTASRFRCA